MSVGILRDTGSHDEHDAYAGLPRSFAWILGLERPMLWLGAAAGGGYLLAASAVFGGVGHPGVTWFHIISTELSYALWFAWVPIAIVILVRGVARDAEDLAPAWGAPPDRAGSLPTEALTVSPVALWLGVAFGLLVTAATVSVMLVLPAIAASLPIALFVSLRELIVEISIFGVMGWAIGSAMKLSRLTEEHARPDLLDPRSFAAHARCGTRLAGVFLVANAITLPMLVSPPDFVGAEVLRAITVLMLVLTSLALVALILPCRGAHRVLRAAKRNELAEVRIQIAEARRAREDERLPGLLAWEARIAGVSEWPIDLPTIRRTGFFVLLPVASWVGAALVERVVERFII